jgi:hypothetical protein
MLLKTETIYLWFIAFYSYNFSPAFFLATFYAGAIRLILRSSMYMLAVMWTYPYGWVLAYMFVVKEIEWCCYKYIYKHDFE